MNDSEKDAQKGSESDLESDFASAMADVRPLADSHNRRTTRRRKLDNVTARARRDAAEGVVETSEQADGFQELSLAEVPQVAPNAELYWHEPGVQPQVLARLRSADFDVRGELDLHGKTVAEARDALASFLSFARENAYRCVLIAHGRGERSDTPARLKSYVAHWLRQLDSVIAFVSAQPRHGGTGAVYVLLRRQRDAKK